MEIAGSEREEKMNAFKVEAGQKLSVNTICTSPGCRAKGLRFAAKFEAPAKGGFAWAIGYHAVCRKTRLIRVSADGQVGL